MVSKVTNNCGAKLTEKSSGVKSDKQLWNQSNGEIQWCQKYQIIVELNLRRNPVVSKVTNNCGTNLTEKSSGVKSNK